MYTEFLEIVGNGKANGQCVKGDNCSFRHDMNKRGKSSPSNPSPNSFMRQNERKPSRTRSPRGKSPSGGMSRWPCKDYLRGTCNNSLCEKWHPPECLFCKTSGIRVFRAGVAVNVKTGGMFCEPHRMVKLSRLLSGACRALVR